MADEFKEYPRSLIDPPRNAAVVTPDDSVALTNVSRGIYVGTSGDLTVITEGGQTITKKSLAAGVTHPMRVTHVKSTGTTAADIIAEW